MSAITANRLVQFRHFPLILTMVVVIFKIAMYLLFIKEAKSINQAGFFFLDSNDRHEYLTPIDNYLEYGSYSLEPNGEPYAGRLPGFIFPYMLFRAIFSQQISNFLLGVFLFAFSIFATFVLSNFLVRRVRSFFVIVVALFALEVIPYFWHLDWVLHPYSLATDCLIISICMLHSYFELPSDKKLLVIGFLIAWLFMLRGVTVLFIPFLLLVLLLHLKRRRTPFGSTLRQLLMFVVPLLVMETVWIGRNYLSLGKIIPLQTSFVPGAGAPESQYGYNSHTKYSLLKLRELINCWGGDNFWYFPKSDMNWFVKASNSAPAQEQFRTVVLEAISPSDLEQLRADVHRSFSHDLSQQEHAILETKIIEDAARFSGQFKQANPLYPFLVAPIFRLQNFLFKNPVQDWPGPEFERSTIIQKGLKGASALIYLTLLILFPIVLVLKLKSIIREHFSMVLLLFTAAMLITFTFLLDTAHYTYFIFGYVPAILLCTLYLPQLLASWRTQLKLTAQFQ